MTLAIWIIAIVEIIRALQNALQLFLVIKSNSNNQMKRATDEFVKSLKKTDAEFVEDILEQLKGQ